jgi:hypothetical protein
MQPELILNKGANDQEVLDGTSPRIYPWNQSQIENPQAPAFIRGVNLKSKISNLKSIDPSHSAGARF